MNEVDHTDLDQMTELLGGDASEIRTNPDGLEVQLALRTLRDHLMAIAERDKVGVNQLARRLGISPSAVSRFLGGEGDIHVSTAVMYGRALGCQWHFSLLPDATCAAHGNYNGRITRETETPKTSGEPLRRSVPDLKNGLVTDQEPKLSVRVIA